MYYSINYIQKVNIPKVTHAFDAISEQVCFGTTFLSVQNPYNRHTVVYIIRYVIDVIRSTNVTDYVSLIFAAHGSEITIII